MVKAGVEDGDGNGGGNWRRTLAAYAELVRVPNLFTAPPDVIAGAAVVAAAGSRAEAPVSLSALAGLAAASVFLYAAGTTLNDAFDAPVDAEERPERPVPSGRISRRAAFGVGAALLLAGVAAAALAAGPAGGLVAGALAAAVLAYDGLLKGSPAGALAMGSARGLNVLLGTAAAGGWSGVLSRRRISVPLAVGLYVAAVTAMAEGEVEGENRPAILIAAAGVVLAAFAVGWHLSAVGPAALSFAVGIALAVAFLLWTGRALRRAYAKPVPATVGSAVGTCVLAIVVLDAAFSSGAGLEWGLAALAFLVPALALSRVLVVT